MGVGTKRKATVPPAQTAKRTDEPWRTLASRGDPGRGGHVTRTHLNPKCDPGLRPRDRPCFAPSGLSLVSPWLTTFGSKARRGVFFRNGWPPFSETVGPVFRKSSNGKNVDGRCGACFPNVRRLAPVAFQISHCTFLLEAKRQVSRRGTDRTLLPGTERKALFITKGKVEMIKNGLKKRQQGTGVGSLAFHVSG